MQQDNNKNKERAALVFAVVGVIILIIAVAGSTFAYFAASASATDAIGGETLDVTLGVTATRVSKGTGKLIPIYDGTVANHDSQLSTAASSTYDCVDKNEHTVCQIYEIVVTNTGEDPTDVDINVTLSGSPNLKWANMTDRRTVDTTYEITETIIAEDLNINGKVDTVNGTVTKYIMVYIKNTGGNQTLEDGAKSFTGTIKVSASTGEYVEATF